MSIRKALFTLVTVAILPGHVSSAHAAVSSATWNVNSAGNWSVGSNWDASDYPSGVGATASFLDATGDDGRTITVDLSPTVGTLNLLTSTNPKTYNFSYTASNFITLDQDGAGPGHAAINANYILTNRTHSLGSHAALIADDLDVNLTGAPFSLVGTYKDNGVGRAITKTGIGEFQLNSTANVLTGAGTVDVQEGTVTLFKSSAGNYGFSLSSNNAKTLFISGNTQPGNDSLQPVTVSGTNNTIVVSQNNGSGGTGQTVNVGSWTVEPSKVVALSLGASYIANTAAGKTLDVQAGAVIDVTNADTNGTGELRISGTLKGTGTVTTADNGSGTTQIHILSGGNLSPGASPGILNIGSATASNTHLLFDAGAAYTVELNGPAAGSGYDQINLMGDVNLGGATLVKTLAFDPAGSPALFFIIANDGADAVTGTFNGLADGAGFNMTGGGATIPFKISYFGDSATNAVTGGNDVVIYAVPEPASLAMLALGGVCFVRRRRN